MRLWSALLNVLAAWKSYKVYPAALIILTWKRDSHPTSQGSLTPGKPDLVFLIHDLHLGTKDLTSPVSETTASGTTDGNWNFTWLRLRLFFFFSLPPQATGVTTFEVWWKEWRIACMIFMKEIPAVKDVFQGIFFLCVHQSGLLLTDVTCQCEHRNIRVDFPWLIVSDYLISEFFALSVINLISLTPNETN